jgi:hypothetical protein
LARNAPWCELKGFHPAFVTWPAGGWFMVRTMRKRAFPAIIFA